MNKFHTSINWDLLDKNTSVSTSAFYLHVCMYVCMYNKYTWGKTEAAILWLWLQSVWGYKCYSTLLEQNYSSQKEGNAALGRAVEIRTAPKTKLCQWKEKCLAEEKPKYHRFTSLKMWFISTSLPLHDFDAQAIAVEENQIQRLTTNWQAYADRDRNIQE